MPNWSESDTALAVAAVRDGSMKCRKAASTYGIPRNTIAGRIHGAQERHEAHAHERRLTKTQEEDLAKWIIDLDSRHQPPSSQRCRAMALEIQKQSGIPVSLGRDWLYQFLERHPQCTTLVGNPHEAIRVNEATEHNVRTWFDFFVTHRDKYQVEDVNIHNMDEHGLCIGKINPRKVVGAAKDQWGQLRKRTKMRNSQTREWVSIVECISAGQTSIQPLIIFKGVNVNINWAPDDPPPYKYAADPSAWINDKLALAWLNEIFEPQTRPRGSQYRILLFDQHTTHLSNEFQATCKKKNIITLPLPSHTSDVLQPLDLVMFSPIKGSYKDRLYELCQLNDSDDTKKKDFCHL